MAPRQTVLFGLFGLFGLVNIGCADKAIDTGSATAATSTSTASSTSSSSAAASVSAGDRLDAGGTEGACNDCYADRYECGDFGIWPGLEGCDLSALASSAITSTTPNGPLAGTRVLFSMYGADCSYSDCQRAWLYVLDDTVDVAEFVAAREADGDPGVYPYFHLEVRGWAPIHALEGSDALAILRLPDETSVSADGVQLTNITRLGSWYVPDPSDPPRLAGTLTIDDPRAGVFAQGTFDALYCDTFETISACS